MVSLFIVKEQIVQVLTSTLVLKISRLSCPYQWILFHFRIQLLSCHYNVDSMFLYSYVL